MCVFAPKGINYIHVILRLYNQLDKFDAFRNVMKLSMHGRGLCNKARHDRNQSNKATYVSTIKVISFTEGGINGFTWVTRWKALVMKVGVV